LLTVDYRRFPVRPGHRVLDLGCGDGRHAFEAYRRGAAVVAFDANHGELRQVGEVAAAMRATGKAPARARAATVGGDAIAMPFGDEVFDRVIAAEVLEHVPGDGRALAEIARVLRPGGLLVVTVPAWLPERICWQLSADYHNIPGGHVRIYTRPGLEAQLRAAGLVVGGHHHAHALHSPYWWLKCAVGVHDDAHPLARAYHRMLVWDITRRPAVTRAAERLLNPLIGKSLVLYARKPGDRAPEPHVPLRETQHDRLRAGTRAGACGPGPACAQIPPAWAQILTAPPRPAHQRRWQFPVMAWRSLGRRPRPIWVMPGCWQRVKLGR